MYVCMYVCMYVHIYIYVCMYVCMYVSACTFLTVFYPYRFRQFSKASIQKVTDSAIYIHTYIHIYIYTHLHIHVHIFISISIALSLSLYIYIYVYIHVHIHLHIVSVFEVMGFRSSGVRVKCSRNLAQQNNSPVWVHRRIQIDIT